jgi:hypothetical protein
MLLKRSVKTLAVFTLLLAAGCSSTSSVSKNAGSLFPSVADKIKIESEPSGAEVYVMGEKIGVTPLNIHPKDVFPNTYQKEKESLYGKVTLKKTGCSDFTRSISTEISNVGLQAQLECGDMNAALAKTSKDARRINETVEQRLDKIKDLLNKGLITEEEAKNARARVLDDL